MRRSLHSASMALLALVWAVSAEPAYASTDVAFAPLTEPGDVADAVAYFRDYFDQRDYQLQTFEHYLRRVVKIGKADINDDGTPEIFYALHDPFNPFDLCGGTGCPLRIAQRQNGKLHEIRDTLVAGEIVTITDRVTVLGYRLLEARFPIMWRDSYCVVDDPDLEVGDQPDPDPLRPSSTEEPRR